MASNLTKEEQKELKVVTPEFIGSYPAVFEPRADDNGNMKYSIAMVFPEGSDRSKMDKAIKLAIKDKWGTKPPSKLSLPIHDDPEEVAEKGYPKGSFYMNVRSDNKPGIVDGSLKDITDPKEIYAGARLRATIKFFAYDKGGKRGVSAGLNNIQKIGDGPRLDGRKAANEDFEALGPADLEEAMAGLK